MPTLALYVHDISPFVIDGLPVRWYGFSYLFGFFLAFLIIRRVLRVGISTFKPEQAADIVVTMALGAVIGGRLGYAIFYDPQLFITFSPLIIHGWHIPFWDLLALNRGGMASHGGMIGFIVASVWVARRMPGGPHRVSHVLDLGTFAAPLGLGFGRIANFVNGELYGRVAPPDLPWAVKFPTEILTWVNDPRKMQSLEPLRQFIPNSALLDSRDLAQQIVTQTQSHNWPLINALAPLLPARHPSQLYEALLEGVVLTLILALVWLKPRKPLVIAGTFGLAYAAVRIIAENYREPDFGIGFQWLGLTRGQWLSVALGAAGVVVILAGLASKGPKMGSWLPVKKDALPS